MLIKQLGTTVARVSAIGQGTGESFWKSPIGGTRKADLLRMGIECGMNLIDTAEGYGDGVSEEVVAKAIEGIRNEVFVATKVSPENLSYDALLRAAEGSLLRLRTDYIDLYQVHWPNPGIPIPETMRAMEQLVQEGKVKYIGVSNFTLKQLQLAQDALSDSAVVSFQVEYNLSDRTIERNILPYCEQNDVTTIAYSPLDQGRISSGHKRIQALNKIAGKYSKTMAQVALNWLVSHSSVIAIPKTINPDHIRENAAAADFELREEDFNEINRIFTQEVVYAHTDRIRVIQGGQGNRQVYQTLKEAVQNRLGFVPSPSDLAQDILDGEVLKPVRVVPGEDKTGRYDYELIEGRIRYWAWVIAYGGEKPIPAYVRDQ